MMGRPGDGGDIMSLGGAPHVPTRAPVSPPTSVSPPPPDPDPAATSSPRDTADLREIVQQAADAGTPLRLAGAGRWLDAGRPVVAARRVDLRALAGIVEYVPGDLTMTAGAGSTLAELQEVARAQGQFIPLDPWGDDSGTLGATLATTTAGPLSAALGLPRDVVLGMSVVTGTGELIRPGGRVVKNVAGFDLVRLMVGAWGTLGVITQATVRLRALPERDQSFAVAVPAGGATGLADWLAQLRAAPLHPLAMELLDHRLARSLELDTDDRDVLLIRLAGNADAVTAQRATLGHFGDPVAAPDHCWARLRGALSGHPVTLRLSAGPSELEAVWRVASALVARAVAAAPSADDAGASPVPDSPAMGSEPPTPQGHRAFLHASVGRGVVRLALPALPEQTLAELLGRAAPPGMRRVFERLPASLWPLLAPSAVADPLSRGVRLAFDPRAILNPGILGAEQDVTAPVSTTAGASAGPATARVATTAGASAGPATARVATAGGASAGPATTRVATAGGAGTGAATTDAAVAAKPIHGSVGTTPSSQRRGGS